MALITTFATTPLTLALYPPWYQKKLEAWKRGEIDWDTGAPLAGSDAESTKRSSLVYEKIASKRVSRVLVYLRIDNMPTIFAFVAILGGKGSESSAVQVHPSQKVDETPEENQKRPLQAHGIRLMELTDRESSVMRVSEVDEYTSLDPIVNTFRTFGSLHNVSASGEVQVIPESSFSDVLVAKSSDLGSDLLLLPWTETGSISETQPVTHDTVDKKLEISTYRSFISSALLGAQCHVAVLVSKNLGGRKKARPGITRTISAISMRSIQEPSTAIADRSHHIFLPFFGGLDDRIALRLVLQMAENPDVTATIVFFAAPDSYYDQITPVESSSREVDSKSGAAVLQPLPEERDSVFFASLSSSVPAGLSSRIVFETVNTETPVKSALDRAKTELGQNPRNAGDLIVVGRSAAYTTAFAKELVPSKNSESVLGVVADAAVSSGMNASVLVVRAGKRGE